MPIYLVVGFGLIGTIAATSVALRMGRQFPPHRAIWIACLVVLGLDSLLHVAISAGAVVQGGWQSTWIVVGTLAIAGVFMTAMIRPAVAGWWLLVTAIALPSILLVTSAIWPADEQESVPVGVLLGFYSTRMIVIGGLLVWSARPPRPGREPSAEAAPNAKADATS